MYENEHTYDVFCCDDKTLKVKTKLQITHEYVSYKITDRTVDKKFEIYLHIFLTENTSRHERHPLSLSLFSAYVYQSRGLLYR